MPRLAPLAPLAGLALIALLVSAGSAQASGIRECGRETAANGYQSITNITSRKVACPTARREAYRIYESVGPDSRGYSRCPHDCVVHFRQWTVTVRYHRWVWDGPDVGWLYYADVRSTASGGRVVRFQAYGE